MLNPDFKFNGGKAAPRTIEKFLSMVEKEYGDVIPERLVNICVSAAYCRKNKPTEWSIRQVFGKASISRERNQKHGILYYQDKWLNEKGLSRDMLVKMLSGRSVHPQAKYIYIASEEPTKRRMLNKEVGYIICQTSTLGWSPLSESCQTCEFVEKCKNETAMKFPELYRIREEYGKTK